MEVTLMTVDAQALVSDLAQPDGRAGMPTYMRVSMRECVSVCVCMILCLCVRGWRMHTSVGNGTSSSQARKSAERSVAANTQMPNTDDSV
jgi:hypothetical protein